MNRTRRSMNCNAAPRCTAVVTMRDGSTADCMRHRTTGDLCTQHAKLAAESRGVGYFTFGLSLTAFMLLGLDDSRLAAETYPSFRQTGRRDVYESSLADAWSILDAIEDHASDAGGFEHTSAECRSLAAAARKLRAALPSRPQ